MKRIMTALMIVFFVITAMFLFRSIFTPSLQASPTLDWDSRLDALNVTYQAATDCSQGCWRLVSAQYQDEQESQGLHHIWARAWDQNGAELEGQTWYVAWLGGSQSLTTKPAGEWADYPMFSCYNPDHGPGGYRAWMGSNAAQSDQVAGMGLPQCLHVSFRLTWQWDEGGQSPTSTPTSTSAPAQATSTSQVSNTATPAGTPATATPTPTASASPTTPAQPAEWDSRFSGLNVTYQPAANCGQGCWRLVSALYEDPNQSGGAHHIFARVRDQAGNLLVDAPWHVAWPDGDVRIMTKAEPDWADYPIYDCYDPNTQPGGYRAYAGDSASQSDQIHGMGLPQCQHVNFRLIWQWDAGGETPTATPSPTSSPTITPTPDPNVVPKLWIPLIISQSVVAPTMTPTPTVINPTATATPSPTATPSGNNTAFTGEVVQTWVNCGLTQIFGVVHDANGQPLPNTRLRLTWDAADAATFYATAGQYVRPETDASGWEFFLNSYPVGNRWHVALIDETGRLISDDLSVYTEGHCNANAANVVKVRFYMR